MKEMSFDHEEARRVEVVKVIVSRSVGGTEIEVWRMRIVWLDHSRSDWLTEPGQSGEEWRLDGLKPCTKRPRLSWLQYANTRMHDI